MFFFPDKPLVTCKNHQITYQNQKSVQISCHFKAFPALEDVTWYWIDKDSNNRSLSAGQEWSLYKAELKNGVSNVRHGHLLVVHVNYKLKVSMGCWCSVVHIRFLKMMKLPYSVIVIPLGSGGVTILRVRVGWWCSEVLVRLLVLVVLPHQGSGWVDRVVEYMSDSWYW